MAVTAPFRFAPIHRRVWFPQWGPLVSHDVPFKDGLSGEIPVEITAETPLLVGGPRRKGQNNLAGEVWPVETIDRDGNQRFAIPGSSLQGFARSLLEIAAFGRLGPFIEDRRFGIRDLVPEAAPFYQLRLNQNSGRHPISVDPRVRAGWLRQTDAGFELRKCELARIEFTDLFTATDVDAGPVPDRNRQPREYAARRAWGKASDAAIRYGWVINPACLACTLPVDNVPRPPYPHCGGALVIAYRKAYRAGGSAIPKTTLYSGNIVLTGNPRDPGARTKHMEFFFFDPQAAVSLGDGFAAKFEEFKALHEPDDGRRTNPNWVYYRDTGYPAATPFQPTPTSFRNGGWMPIFYLPDRMGGIESFGLAFMFKLAHQRTTHELLANSSPDHLDERRLDLASLIFGAIADREAGTGVKRRASFDFALGTLPPGETAHATPRPTVLLGPKPSYYPIYIRQPEGATPGELPHYRTTAGENRRLPYATFTPLDGTLFQPAEQLRDEHRFPELAGVKIWPTRRSCLFPALPLAPPDSNAQLQSWLWALPRRTNFSTKLRFQNLRPAELGAVLWALTFGDNRAWTPNATIALRHRIGMGKPHALGEVSIRLGVGTIVANHGEAPSYSALIDAFTDAMDRACATLGLAGAWAESKQVKALRNAAAGLGGAQDKSYRYMQLGDGRHPPPGTYRAEKAAGRFLRDYVDGKEFLRGPPDPPFTLPDGGRASRRPSGERPEGGSRGRGVPERRPPVDRWPAFSIGARVVDHADGEEGIVRSAVSPDGRVEVAFDYGPPERVPVSRLRPA